MVAYMTFVEREKEKREERAMKQRFFMEGPAVDASKIQVSVGVGWDAPNRRVL
jgi:hypothetical protein